MKYNIRLYFTKMYCCIFCELRITTISFDTVICFRQLKNSLKAIHCDFCYKIVMVIRY